jgi:ABC-type multidrug transport system permease subunit
MSILFNGVLQTPGNLPGFWLFMYRVSPFTYWVGGMVAVMLAGRPVECASREVSILDPLSGQTCGQYLGPYAQAAGGTIQNPNDTDTCRYCSLSNADQFLAGSNIYYSERWR